MNVENFLTVSGEVSVSDFRIPGGDDEDEYIPGELTARTVTVGSTGTLRNYSWLRATERLTINGGTFTSYGDTIVSSDVDWEPREEYADSVYVGTGSSSGIFELFNGTKFKPEDNGFVWIDGLQGTRAHVQGAGTTLGHLPNLLIGENYSGELWVYSGAKVSADVTKIATAEGSSAVVKVSGKAPDGTSSLFDTGIVVIGGEGSAQLDILAGGHVVSSAATVGKVTSLLGNGIVNIDGQDSKWNVANALIVGDGGEGAVTIRGGGRLQVGVENSTVGTMIIGRNTLPAFASTVTVEGTGSTLEVFEGEFTVGDGGSAELHIKNGATVDSNQARIGYLPGSRGYAKIENASWVVRNTLRVGVLGEATLEVGGDGIVVARQGVFIGPGGNVIGAGVIEDDLPLGTDIIVENSGTVAPGRNESAAAGGLDGGFGGSLPATMTINAAYRQTSTGKLHIDIASRTSYDVLHVTGNASLAGTLAINLLNGYTPAPMDTFNFLNATSRSGAFNTVTVTVPTGPAGTFTVSPTATGLALSNFQPDPSYGLIAYWNAENGATDITGNGHDGIFQGNAATVTAGPNGKAFTFDGSGDFINIGDELDMAASDFTLTAWINGDPSMDQWARILDKGYATGYASAKWPPPIRLASNI